MERAIDVTKLEALIAKWRETADIWERHNMDYVPAITRRGVDHPPEKGRASIRNWINWLRNCANDAEACITSDLVDPVREAERVVTPSASEAPSKGIDSDE